MNKQGVFKEQYKLIQDPQIKQFVCDTLDNTPDYFFYCTSF